METFELVNSKKCTDFTHPQRKCYHIITPSIFKVLGNYRDKCDIKIFSIIFIFSLGIYPNLY